MNIIPLSPFSTKNSLPEQKEQKKDLLSTTVALEVIKGSTTRALLFQTPSASPQQPILQRLCHEPYQLLEEIHQYRKKKAPLSSFPFDEAFLFLDVCPCEKMDHKLRAELENGTIDLFNKTHSLEEATTIVSVGTGLGYEELVFLAKFAESGRKEMKLITIDPLPVPIGALILFCQRHLSHCKIEISYYNSLTAYLDAESSQNLAPDLLLLIDLTTVKVGHTSLSDYSFTLLKDHGLLKNNTVIAYSTLDIEITPSQSKFTPKAICCCYDGSHSLSQIQMNRKEFNHIQVLDIFEKFD